MKYIIDPLPIVGVTKYILILHRRGRLLQLKKDKSILGVLEWKVLHKLNRLLCSYVGCYIPFGAKICKGIVLPHGLYGVFLSKNSCINFGVTMLHQVTIGSNPLSSSNNAPTIGCYSFIGAGAKIIGEVYISSNSVISVNQVVTKKSFMSDDYVN